MFRQTSLSPVLVLRDGERARIRLPCLRKSEGVKKKKVNTKATPRTSEKTLLFYLRIQHISGNKATYRNIIGRKFCHPVQCAVLRRDVCCWPSLKMVKFFIQQLRMLRDVVLVWPCCGRARALVRFVTPNVSQHVATPNMSQHVTTGLANTGSTVLRSLN